jgi:hypothetical protein
MSDVLVKRQIVELVYEIWIKYPDVRLGQLMVNCLGDNMFYIEDDEAKDRLHKALRGGEFVSQNIAP